MQVRDRSRLLTKPIELYGEVNQYIIGFAHALHMHKSMWMHTVTHAHTHAHTRTWVRGGSNAVTERFARALSSIATMDDMPTS